MSPLLTTLQRLSIAIMLISKFLVLEYKTLQVLALAYIFDLIPTTNSGILDLSSLPISGV